MCLRYSSSVVAPTARSSPRASIGLSRFAASTEPSAEPAPTIVCSSSMKRTIVPSESAISLRTALSRSSNSPRYFAPAISAPTSSATTRRSRRPSGTSPETIRCASPSAMAVLPTPGSPISTGLFFVRRLSTWITRRISSSRPMTGSSLPSCAAAVRSRPYLSSAWNLSSGFMSVTRCGPRTAPIASRSTSLRAPASRRISPAFELWPASDSSRCSVETYSSPRPRISASAARSTWISSWEGPLPPDGPVILACASSAPFTVWRIAAGSAPTLRSTGATIPSDCSSRTASRCSGVACGLARSSASRRAAWIASWDLIVKRSSCMGSLQI